MNEFKQNFLVNKSKKKSRKGSFLKNILNEQGNGEQKAEKGVRLRR